MRSPEKAIFRKELASLLSSRSTLSLLVLSSFLVGYGFTQAIDLYSEASRAALEHKELSPGMNPFEGILVPTFGSLYLITTLLFPFIAIRSISHEKESSTLKLLLQLPTPFSKIVTIKALVIFLGWVLSLIPAILAVTLWLSWGGHVNFGELFSLLAGHALYAITVIGISFLIAALTESSATASLFVLAVTLGSWVLDFAVSSHSSPFMRNLSGLSLTANIRPFERGLISSEIVIRFIVVSVSTALVAFYCLSLPRGSVLHKAKTIGTISALGLAVLFCSFMVPFYADLSEDRRNSFSVEHEALLKQIRNKLQVRIALSPDDPRYKDLQRNVLSKLQRVVPKVTLSLVSTGKSNLFGVGADESYGLNEYEYQGKIETSRSTSPREILPLIYRLVELSGPEVKGTDYPGYPLVAKASSYELLFYLFLPLFFLFLWWWNHRIPNSYGGK